MNQKVGFSVNSSQLGKQASTFWGKYQLRGMTGPPRCCKWTDVLNSLWYITNAMWVCWKRGENILYQCTEALQSNEMHWTVAYHGNWQHLLSNVSQILRHHFHIDVQKCFYPLLKNMNSWSMILVYIFLHKKHREFKFSVQPHDKWEICSCKSVFQMGIVRFVVTNLVWCWPQHPCLFCMDRPLREVPAVVLIESDMCCLDRVKSPPRGLLPR